MMRMEKLSKLYIGEKVYKIMAVNTVIAENCHKIKTALTFSLTSASMVAMVATLQKRHYWDGSNEWLKLMF